MSFDPRGVAHRVLDVGDICVWTGSTTFCSRFHVLHCDDVFIVVHRAEHHTDRYTVVVQQNDMSVVGYLGQWDAQHDAELISSIAGDS